MTETQFEKAKEFISFGWEFDGNDKDKIYMQRWQNIHDARVRVGLRIEITEDGNVKELRQ